MGKNAKKASCIGCQPDHFFTAAVRSRHFLRKVKVLLSNLKIRTIRQSTLEDDANIASLKNFKAYVF